MARLKGKILRKILYFIVYFIVKTARGFPDPSTDDSLMYQLMSHLRVAVVGVVG